VSVLGDPKPTVLSGDLEPTETELRGSWRRQRGRVVADEVCLRIESVRTNCLRQLGADVSGWDTLFVDPRDGRLWEIVYEHSEWHGGGPPTLRVIDGMAAKIKYPKAFI
jgi:Immunity protein 27